MEKLLVWKFGGTSVGDVERIRHVASLMEQAVRKGFRLTVVVSAMGGYTDKLISLAHSLNASPPRRELDMLVTTGERISMSLLSIALASLGVSSISLTGSQSGILTDENHGNARIVGIRGDRIIAGLKQVPVVIIAGFQGVSPKSKDITSLGRGGSDLSAVALAIHLGAGQCEIFTDVPGVMTADPGAVPGARLLRKMPWDMMCDYALNGAGVLHHRAANLAAIFKMPLVIRSTFTPDQEGTFIAGGSEVEESKIVACAHRKDQCLLVATGSCITAAAGIGYRLYSRLQEWLCQRDEYPFISQFYSDLSGFRLTLLVAQKFARPASAMLQQAVPSGQGWNLELARTDNCAGISLIGSGFRQSPNVMAQAGAIVGSDCLCLDLQDRCVSFVVRKERLEQLLNELHRLVVTP